MLSPHTMDSISTTRRTMLISETRRTMLASTTRTLFAALSTLALLAASCHDGAATKAAQSTSSAPPPPASAPKSAAQSAPSAPRAADTSSSAPSSPDAQPGSASASDGSGAGRPPSTQTPPPPVVAFGYEIVRSMPHDRRAFTQGFLFDGGFFYESTGLYGSSSLRRILPLAGQALNKIDLPQSIFAEGLTMLDGKLYMLTWKSQKGFIYDPTTLKQLGEFAYTGEGWGLANDGKSLILSDGTSRLRFIDPKTFAVTRGIDVTLDGKAVEELNELEYVKGEIFANVWHENFILRIDPSTGRVIGKADLTGISTPAPDADVEDVLNGIAYDAASDRLFVTGKRWLRVFEIKLVKK
jgi:glutamine cyclotransferase